MITTKQTKTFFLIVKFQEQWTNNLNNNIYTINYKSEISFKNICVQDLIMIRQMLNLMTEFFNSVLKFRIDADMRSISF